MGLRSRNLRQVKTQMSGKQNAMMMEEINSAKSQTSLFQDNTKLSRSQRTLKKTSPKRRSKGIARMLLLRPKNLLLIDTTSRNKFPYLPIIAKSTKTYKLQIKGEPLLELEFTQMSCRNDSACRTSHRHCFRRASPSKGRSQIISIRYQKEATLSWCPPQVLPTKFWKFIRSSWASSPASTMPTQLAF